LLSVATEEVPAEMGKKKPHNARANEIIIAHLQRLSTTMAWKSPESSFDGMERHQQRISGYDGSSQQGSQ